MLLTVHIQEVKMKTIKSILAIVVAALALQAGAAAQVAADAQAAAHAKLLAARATAAPAAFHEAITSPASQGQVLSNLGAPASWTFQGHALSLADGGQTWAGTATAILYAPSEDDDPAYRAAISAAAGGAIVDYFDARAATPSVATLLQYDAVHTWVDFGYADKVAFGNNLATYNDNGGTVVLGVFCTYTSGNSLGGTIMTAGYNPVVSPFGTNHFASSSYTGGGTSCIYDGVASLTCTFRDFLATQGSGVVDGKYADGEICHAYRGASGPGQGQVVYSNGTGSAGLGSAGPWGTAVGNGCTCFSATNAWTDEGSALAGVSGDPLLSASGSMVPTTAQSLALSNAAGSALSAIVASGSSSPTAFKGGTLLPGPDTVAVLMMTSPAGGWSLVFRAPAAASGFELWIQVGIQDAAAVKGVALSNAVKGVTP